MDTSLASFGAGEAKPTAGLVGVANAAYLTDPPERENIKGWKTQSTEYGLTTHQVDCETKAGKSHGATKQEVRWVSGGDLAGYVEKYGDELRSLPSTYGGFSGGAYEPYLGCVDGLVEDNYGYGISGRAAERGLRILNDNGRYQASKYHIITANEHPWVLSGPKGVLLCSPTPVKRTMKNARTVPVEFSETTVDTEEENPIVLEALRRVEAYLADGAPPNAANNVGIELQPEPSLAFVEHEDVPTSTKFGGCDQHVFNTEAGISVKIEREDFHNLGTMELQADRLPGVQEPATVTSPSGKSITISHTPEREIGEFYEEGLVVGYSFDWDVFPYSPEEVAVVTTYHIEMPADSVESPFTVTVNRTESRIATTSVHY